jgi:predicted TIM-barrel fold metal-dependent hydrolase
MAFPIVISADSHVIEPLDLWRKALGSRYGTDAPGLVNRRNGVEGTFFFTGREYMDAAEMIPGDNAMQARLLEAGRDPAVRLTCMREDKVTAEVINSTWCLFIMRVLNDALVRDCCRVFNDWIAEYCSHAPQILLGTAMIPMADVEWAVSEMERCAKKGMRTVLINADTRPGWRPYRDGHYDRFWAAACDLGMPVTIHVLTGEAVDPVTLYGREREDLVRTTLGCFDEAGPVLGNEFIYGGVFDRFPELKVVLSEFEVSWLPYYVFRMRQIQEVYGPSMGVPGPKRGIDEYMARQVFHGMIDDPYLGKVLDVIDHRTILWGSDFPHARCTYPKTHEILERTVGHLSGEMQADIVWRNAARLFRIDVPGHAA